MSKSIVIKSGIILLVLGAIHSVFWFFKTGQIEKQVNNFISENSAYVSSGEVAVSGFPLAQKVSIKDLKFTLPNPALNKYQITVKSLEATAGIFNNNFSVVLLEQVLVQDNENTNSGYVEFSKEPEITASISDGMISKFSYLDSGYRVLDAEKNVIYAASSSTFSVESSIEEGDKIKTKIIANLKDIEGFDIINAYKNSSEKKIIEGIKTGEITIGNNAASADALIVATPNLDAAATIPAMPANPIDPSISAASTSPAPAMASATPQDPNAAPTKTEDLAAALSNNNLVKSNFAMDIEYTLVPNQSEQQSQVPTDPSQIQDTPVQYSKVIKINNFEFSNPLYKISLNGQLNAFQDDALLSGAVTMKVEKIDNLVNHISTGLSQIADQKKPVAEIQSGDLAAAEVTPVTQPSSPSVAPAVSDVAAPQNPVAPTPSATSDSYQTFLKRFASNLPMVTKELTSKNPLSKDDVAVFDIRREKNIEFLINETPMREILGKF